MPQPATILVIQYLRGVAAVMVVIYHTTMMAAVSTQFPVHFGRSGVDLFFVISGFVMWSTTEDGTRRPLPFWRARIRRIVPLYWLATTLFIAGIIAAPHAALTARVFDAAHLLKSVLFIPAVDPGIGSITPIYSVGWTLQYEMFFYAVFGLCLLIKTRAARATVILAAFAGLIVTGQLLQPDNPILLTWTNPLLLEFVAGVAVAIIRHRLARIPAPYALPGLLVGCILLAADQYITAPDTLLLATGSGATLIVASSLAFESFAQKHPLRWLRMIGDASYSIYLMHPLLQRAAFIVLTRIMTGGIHTTTDLIIYSIIAIAAGTLGGVACYVLIERPLVRRKQNAHAIPAPLQPT